MMPICTTKQKSHANVNCQGDPEAPRKKSFSMILEIHSMKRVLCLLLVALTIGGCLCPVKKEPSCFCEHSDITSINRYLRLRCAAATPQDRKDFKLICEMISDQPELDLFIALQTIGDMAFSGCFDINNNQFQKFQQDRLQQYEDVIIGILSGGSDTKCCTCLRWLYVNQQYTTKRIVDAIFEVAECSDTPKQHRSITFLAVYFGFTYAGFFFSDDELPGGIKNFPLDLVRHYWSKNYKRIIQNKNNLEQYSRLGFYHDLDSILKPFPTGFLYCDYPRDMHLYASQFPAKVVQGRASSVRPGRQKTTFQVRQNNEIGHSDGTP
jgi:hypothetical protein